MTTFKGYWAGFVACISFLMIFGRFFGMHPFKFQPLLYQHLLQGLAATFGWFHPTWSGKKQASSLIHPTIWNPNFWLLRNPAAKYPTGLDNAACSEVLGQSHGYESQPISAGGAAGKDCNLR